MLLSVDVGSGSIRVGLISEDGNAGKIWRAPTAAPVRHADQRVGLDLEALSTVSASLIRLAAEHARRRGEIVDGLTCTSFRYAFVLLQGGSAVASWANIDRSSGKLAARLNSEAAPEQARDRGGWSNPLTASSRLAWASHHCGEQAMRGATFLPLHSWLLHSWGARVHCDSLSAADTRLFDIHAGDWVDESVVTMPPVVEPGVPVGALDGAAAGAFGLPAGLPLISASGDSHSALSAFSDLRAGDIVVVAGTTTPVVAISDGQPTNDWEPAAWSHSQNWWYAERNAGRTGAVTRWFLELTQRQDFLRDLELAALSLGAVGERLGVMAYLGPTISEPRDFGFPQATSDVHLEVNTTVGLPSAPLLHRAVIEANAWATLYHVQRLAATLQTEASRPERRTIVVGGQSQSGLFCSNLAGGAPGRTFAHSIEPSLVGAAQAFFSREGVSSGGERVEDGVAIDDAPDTSACMRDWIEGWRNNAAKMGAWR